MKRRVPGCRGNVGSGRQRQSSCRGLRAGERQGGPHRQPLPGQLSQESGRAVRIVSRPAGQDGTDEPLNTHRSRVIRNLKLPRGSAIKQRTGFLQWVYCSQMSSLCVLTQMLGVSSLRNLSSTRWPAASIPTTFVVCHFSPTFASTGSYRDRSRQLRT